MNQKQQRCQEEFEIKNDFMFTLCLKMRRLLRCILFLQDFVQNET